SRVLRILSMLVRVEEHRLAAGKHLRPAVGPIRAARFRYWRETSAPPRNSRQCAQREGGDDVAIFPPARTSGSGRVAQRYRCASANRNLLQLAIGEKSDPLAVRREEWTFGVVRTTQYRRVILIEHPRRQFRHAISTAGRKDQSAVVRRNRQHVLETVLRQWNVGIEFDAEPHRCGRCSGPCHTPPGLAPDDQHDASTRDEPRTQSAPHLRWRLFWHVDNNPCFADV